MILFLIQVKTALTWPEVIFSDKSLNCVATAELSSRPCPRQNSDTCANNTFHGYSPIASTVLRLAVSEEAFTRGFCITSDGGPEIDPEIDAAETLENAADSRIASAFDNVFGETDGSSSSPAMRPLFTPSPESPPATVSSDQSRPPAPSAVVPPSPLVSDNVAPPPPVVRAGEGKRSGQAACSIIRSSPASDIARSGLILPARVCWDSSTARRRCLRATE